MAKKAKKAKKTKNVAGKKGRRVVVKLQAVRAELEKGITTLQAEVDGAIQRAKSQNKAAVAKARRRITYLKQAVKALRQECPDKILNVDFTFE